MAQQWENVHEVVITNDYSRAGAISVETISTGVIKTDVKDKPFGLYDELVKLYTEVSTSNHVTKQERWLLQLEILREIANLNR